MSVQLRGIALVAALGAVFGFSVQNAKIDAITGHIDSRGFRTYTPYFPGLAALDTHKIFDPQYAHKRKIVMLGASAIDSIGVDYTWHRPIPGQERNVSSWASVPGQLNEILHAHGRTDWEVFNLARNGMKLTSELYVYARILPLKPDLVVMGEAFDYYHWENADANALDGRQYAFLDKTFGAYPETAGAWKAYRATLAANGWKPPQPEAPDEPYSVDPIWQKDTRLADLAVLQFEHLQSAHLVEPILYPVRYTHFRTWVLDQDSELFDHSDPKFGYFQGYTLISDIQRKMGGKSFFYFTPQWSHHEVKSYIDRLDNVYGRYLTDHGVPYANYVPRPLKPIYETYDGSHATLYGNRRIAQMIYDDLVSKGLLN